MHVCWFSLWSIITYYEQAISQILSGSDYELLSGFTGIFDISALNVADGLSGGGSSESNDWCFIDGLNAKWKLVLDLIAPLMIWVLMTALFVFSRCILRRPLRFKQKTVDFQAAGLALFLLIIGNVFNMLSKLISTQSLGDDVPVVHWYFGNEQSYGVTYIVAMMVFLALVLSFGGVFVFGRTLTVEQRSDPESMMYLLTKRFSPRYWYWEYVIFTRRIIVALFAVGITWSLSKLAFVMIIMMFIGIQWRLNPFVSNETNQVMFHDACFRVACNLVFLP